MGNHELDALARRIESLEAETRRLRRSGGRWRGLCAAFLACACVLPLVGWKGSDKVTGESIRLVKDGKLRAMMSVTKKGTAALTLMDANQHPRTMLSVSAQGVPKLAFMQDGGKRIRMTLSATEGGNLALLLNDTQGKERASILVDSKGEGHLRVKDATGALKK